MTKDKEIINKQNGFEFFDQYTSYLEGKRIACDWMRQIFTQGQTDNHLILKQAVLTSLKVIQTNNQFQDQHSWHQNCQSEWYFLINYVPIEIASRKQSMNILIDILYYISNTRCWHKLRNRQSCSRKWHFMQSFCKHY